MLRQAKGVLLDWDGCVAIENRILPHAVALIADHAEKIAIVSNNSTHLPTDFVDSLANQGVDFVPDRILLAGAEALRIVAGDKDARVMLIAEARMRDCARDLGIVLENSDPNIVLMMRDKSFSYAKLERAANALRAGARLVVANADMSHPGREDRIVPETGALLAALLACSDKPEIKWQLIGKPGPMLFKSACAALGVSASEAVMVGDNPMTDGKGATSAGIQPILIGQHSHLNLEHLVESVVG